MPDPTKKRIGDVIGYPGLDPLPDPALLPQGGDGQDVDKKRMYDLLQKKMEAEQANPDIQAMRAQENANAAMLTDTGFKPEFVPGPGDFGYVPPKFQKIKQMLGK